jgi:transcriptional regulator with XRE-family HTH domain
MTKERLFELGCTLEGNVFMPPRGEKLLPLYHVPLNEIEKLAVFHSTPEELIELLGVSDSIYSSWERRNYLIDLSLKYGIEEATRRFYSKPPPKYQKIDIPPVELDFITSYREATGISMQAFVTMAIKEKITRLDAEQSIKDQELLSK